jgi:hypothetical protein
MNRIWPKVVHFNYCKFVGCIDPKLETNTEQLKIKTIATSKLRINWRKFPKLRILYLDEIANVDFTDIHHCKELEFIYCYRDKRYDIFVLPRNIGKLENLKYLITNCIVENNTNFISEKLTTFICFNKNKNCFNFKSSVKITDFSLDCENMLSMFISGNRSLLYNT